MKKVNKKMLISLTTITSTIIGVTPIVVNSYLNNSSSNFDNNEFNSNNNVNQKEEDSKDVLNDVNQQQDVKPLIKTENNYFNPRLSTKNGPITFWGNTITSVDWFGGSRWEKDVSKIDVNGSQPFVGAYASNSWKRNWLNFDLDKKNDILYILNNKKGAQSVVSIDINSGQVLKEYKLHNNSNGYNGDTYFTLSVLDNSNVLVFGQQGHAISKSELIDVKNNMVTKNQGNLESVSKKYNNVTNNYLMNLIPIAENRNLAITYNFTNKPGTQGDAGKVDENTSRVDFILCDDNMNSISDATNGWNEPKLATMAIPGTMNSAMWPQRDWYRLLDGRIVTIIYDKLFVIDGRTNINNPTFTSLDIGKNKWVESWSFDTDEKLYFKIKDDTVIQTVTLDSNKNGANHTLGTYYNLKDSLELIKNNASKFSLYNVYRYSGQIMIINSYWNNYIDLSRMPTDDQINQNSYGLAAAITSNKDKPGEGDTKGLLNTDKAFQKSADFTLDKEILKKKLPSEITRNDLTLLNNSFFTKRTDSNSNGLIYEPFVKTEMDDINKKIKIVVNIDQIPWFVTTNEMPTEIKPLKIEKEFSSEVDIKTRFIWKNIEVEDYDFKNTLPSKLEVNDIQRISPLISTLTSQNIKIGLDNYPKTTYSLSEQNDVNGTIKITAKYEYIPMDTKAIPSNVKSYTLEKTFNMFKSGTQKQFLFVSNGSNTTQDINNIPALKELKEANLFPSHFKSASKQEFLKFIDINKTKGYPLEKMNITVEDNDNLGTLKVIVNPKNYDPTLNQEVITYTGLNKKGSYKFDFLDPNSSTFNKKQYKPSDVNNELLYKYFLKYSGFDSSDLKINLTPNDENGNLSVNVSLNVNYPDEILLSSGFKNINGVYVQSKIISGFKTNSEFNNEYQLNFKTDLDKTLVKVKELTPATIKSKIDEKNLMIEGKQYKSIYELINLFISSKGPNIPTIEQNQNIVVNMFVNNSGGEITFSITFKALSGYSNSITFIQKFSGFAKGNDDVTNDVLTFKDSNQLKITEESYFNKMPSDIKKELEANKSNISRFLSGTPTGDYKKSIDSNDFDLEIIADDNYGNLTINIIFKRSNISNEKSLLEYSQTFEGFKHY